MTAIIEKGYHVTVEQVEQMAREVRKGYDGVQTYLRCLIVAASESKRRGLRAVDEAHERFYPAVLRGVGGEAAAATFARTAASTLRGYLKAGGKLADIDVATATKASLRAYGKPAEPVNRAERSAGRAADMLLRALKRMARRDIETARRMAAEVVEELRAAVPVRGVVRVARHVPEGTRPAAH